jgi:hypothetical protein
MRKPPRQDRSTSLRIAAFSIVSFLAIGQISELIHIAFVPHTTCAEHGELIHPTGSEDVAPGHQTRSRHASAILEAESRPSPANGHEHCAFTIAHARNSDFLSPPNAVATVVHFECLPSVDAIFAFISTPLLLMAPKCSPPAFA